MNFGARGAPGSVKLYLLPWGISGRYLIYLSVQDIDTGDLQEILIKGICIKDKKSGNKPDS
jgi:hypothetical protein